MEGLKKGILVKNSVAVGAVGDKYFSNAPIGVIQAYSGTTIPNGYLLCDGASYKVADYPDLYAVIGNTYGGDTENFNVPNLLDKFIQGSTTSGTEKEAGLPNITGGWMPSVPVNYQLYATGAVIPEIKSSGLVSLAGSQAAIGAGFKIDASKSSAVYGKSTTVQPPALTMVYIIKAFHTNEGVDSGVSDDVINYVETKLVDLGGREQSVTFPFTPTVNGTLILTIGQKSIDPVARAVNVKENGENFYSINNYFGASWGASSASLPLVKGKTYTVEDPDDVIMYEKTKFIY